MKTLRSNSVQAIFLALLFTTLTFAQPELIILMSDVAGIGEYPVTADLLHSYDEREMTISSWNDQTGTADLIQETAGLQPILTANAINGYTGLLFDGADNYMGVSGLDDLATFTVYFVVKPVSWTDSDMLFYGNGTDLYVAQGGGGTNMYMFAGSAEPIRAFGFGDYKIACCVFNGASAVFQVNDDVATGNVGTVHLGNGFYIAARSAGTNPGNFEYVAIYLHSGSHDLATRTTIINWLNSKYGVY